ncbi:hypothetical protein GFS03_08155 [Sulfolobus sp. E5-1-F]|uniref:hypothetical protein n=1 Tax=Saccharolobus sp. E5-1-F TaxID=2663019 RepID=UPI001296219B|nr:hypothetical protein [Sulfolobus sp. E5-1-F]QGA54544.1 hypothetical protein GFS03_08155 [Sulfolobus sp. E5-1-F]
MAMTDELLLTKDDIDILILKIKNTAASLLSKYLNFEFDPNKIIVEAMLYNNVQLTIRGNDSEHNIPFEIISNGKIMKFKILEYLEFEEVS